MAIGIILAIVIALATVGAVVLSAANSDENPKLSRIAAIVGIILVIAFILVPFSFRTVSSGEVAVVKHLGKYDNVRTAGTYFDLWLTNSYMKYDTKVQNIDASTAAYSSDAQTMDIQITIQYQINTDNVMDIATQYGKLEVLENRITSVALEKTKAVLSSHKAMDIIANRATISPDVETAVMEAVGEEYFVDIVAVVITNIDFSDAFDLAVEEKMIAEQAKLKADYENQIIVATAEAEAEAQLRAAEAAIEIARAEAEALMIAAEAEAEANRVVNESLTEMIIKKIMADAWNGELPLVTGSGDYILPSEMLQ